MTPNDSSKSGMDASSRAMLATAGELKKVLGGTSTVRVASHTQYFYILHDSYLTQIAFLLLTSAIVINHTTISSLRTMAQPTSSLIDSSPAEEPPEGPESNLEAKSAANNERIIGDEEDQQQGDDGSEMSQSMPDADQPNIEPFSILCCLKYTCDCLWKTLKALWECFIKCICGICTAICQC